MGETASPTTIPPYASSGSSSASVSPGGTQFPQQTVASQVGIREATRTPKAESLLPVTLNNTSDPITVADAEALMAGHAVKINGQSVTMSSTQRKDIQQQMFDGGLLTKQSDVSGDVNANTAAKWKSIVAEAAQNGNSIQAHLDITGNSQVYNQIGNDLQKQATSLQSAISAPKSLNIPLTNEAVLRDYAEKAWTAAQGHAPSEKEMQAFVSDWHQSETAAGETQLSQPRQYAQGQLDRTNSELADLKGLGPNGLDTFVHAYKSVMSGDNPTGDVSTQNQSLPQAALGEANPLAPMVTNHGGAFAMSPQTWVTAAKAANVDTKKYPTPTSAPQSIQSAVFSHYADGLFAKLGNWADVATVASGGKAGANDPSSFGGRVVTEVNDQVKSLVGQINAPGPDNIVASASADTSGMAAQQSVIEKAKSSDPTGYYAHQISLYEGLLNHIAGGGGGLPQQVISPSTIGMPPEPSGPVQSPAAAVA